MLRFLKILVLSFAIIFLSWGLFNLNRQSRHLKTKINDLEATTESISKENQNFKKNIEYYSHPENLLKELKSLFNYRQPEEKLIIIIPNNGQNENH